MGHSDEFACYMTQDATQWWLLCTVCLTALSSIIWGHRPHLLLAILHMYCLVIASDGNRFV